MALSIDMSNKTILISGAISGIGFGVAKMFAQAGAKVIACAELDASHPLVADYAAAMQAFGGANYYRADLTQQADIAALAAKVEQEHGKLDVLVSNAGKNVFNSVEQTTQSEWDFNQKLNLESHWQLATAMKPLLDRSDAGLVILMGSNHAFSTMPGCFPYSVAKAGLLAMVRSMAMEWGPNIRCLGIAPGFIDTPGNQAWFDSFPDPDAARAETVALHPVKRLGTAEEIGGWCVFLASPFAAFATGTTYLIDGGRSTLMQD